MNNFIDKNLILIVTLSIISFFFICYFISRVYKICNHRTKASKLQLPEYIKNKNFIASDQYHLSTLGTIDENGAEIILAIHDSYGNKSNFTALINNKALKKNKISVLSFNQRNIGDNNYYKVKNVGILIEDIVHAINALHSKYEKQNIILLLESFYCGLIPLILEKQEIIQKIILVNPVTKTKAMKFSFFSKIGVFFGFIFNLNRKLNINIDYGVFTENKEYIAKCEKDHQSYFLNSVLQINQINKRVNKKINKIVIPTLLIQSDGSQFLDCKKFIKIKNSKIKIMEISSKEHYLFIDNLDEKIVENINALVNIKN